ncbi:hypothetical protein BH10PLA2_BH10PLA2_00380 [soil metagenome]
MKIENHSLTSTIARLAPLIRAFNDYNQALPDDQYPIAFSHPLILTLTDEPIKREKRITTQYAKRIEQFSDALEQALGEEWLVGKHEDFDLVRHGNKNKNVVMIHGSPSKLIYDQAGNNLLPGSSKQSWDHFSIFLAAMRFGSLSEKVAFLICRD